MSQDEMKKHAEGLQQIDVEVYVQDKNAPTPWFALRKKVETEVESAAWYCALVPPALVSKLLERGCDWDFHMGDGIPSVWTIHQEGQLEQKIYCPYGNRDGIEPLVLSRTFHGLREPFIELSQEFRLFHNLYPDPKNNRFVHIDANGDESEAVRYGKDFLEVRTDLLQAFCNTKQMAVAVYVDSIRYSPHKLEELGLQELREIRGGEHFKYQYAIVPHDDHFQKSHLALSRVLGKKFFLPAAMPVSDEGEQEESYQEFIIGADANGKPVRHSCDPEKLANFFGKNPHAPQYLTPVFFRAEVLTKYHASPQKYSVEDGYLRCGALWGLQMDNDHPDYVMVYLGDLGRDLSESERNYWLSFNIPPQGRRISSTAFKRGFMAEFADPNRPDLVFKHEYERFCRDFKEACGWDFFLPLHTDDQHFLTALRLPADGNQAEFDTQLLALTKVVVDSLNEKEITKGLATLTKDDKGIAKLEKFFKERGATGFEPHIKFLRVLQDLRSKSAAHRKGSNYDKLVADLQLADEGQQKVFATLLMAGNNLIGHLRDAVLPKPTT